MGRHLDEDAALAHLDALPHRRIRPRPALPRPPNPAQFSSDESDRRWRPPRRTFLPDQGLEYRPKASVHEPDDGHNNHPFETNPLTTYDQDFLPEILTSNATPVNTKL